MAINFILTNGVKGEPQWIMEVSVIRIGDGEFENEYGILGEITEVEYLGEPLKKCVLFTFD